MGKARETTGPTAKGGARTISKPVTCDGDMESADKRIITDDCLTQSDQP